MLRFVILVLFAATTANAGFHSFHRHRQFTTDMNGFHNFGHHGHHGHHHGFGQFDQFGPPFGPQFHHGHHHGHGHNHHSPQCNHNPGNGFGTFPFAPIPMPSPTGTAPFIPNINNPFFHGTNFPFNPQNPFLPNPNQNGGNVPSTVEQNHFGCDPTNTNTLTPIDANTALDDHSSTTTPITPTIVDVDNGGNEQPSTPPNQSNGSTDPNSGTGTTDSVSDPSSAASTPTTPPDQGKNNELDYDIDVRFSDGKTNNETNQKPLDTNQP